MTATVNLPAIIAADAFGIMLIVVLLMGNYWRFKERSRENVSLMVLVICVLTSCFADSMSCILDGKPGPFAWIMNYFANMYLYAMNPVTGAAWTAFLISHLNGRVTRRHDIFMMTINTICVVGLIVNFFVPVVFSISPENVYSRGPLFYMYLAAELLYLGEGMFIYARAKRDGGVLKYFPMWAFMLPVIVGIAAQTVFYGISTIWAGVAVAMGGTFAGMQNERIFQDRLTGLNSRFYLDYVKSRAKRRDAHEMTIMMLDLNGFKEINDTYGHSAGDRALADFACILRSAVGTSGTAIRYAGDEFLVLINTRDESAAQSCVRKIQAETDRFNREGGREYKLSVSIGYSACDLKAESLDHILSIVDQRMYAAKHAYYSGDGKHGRRAGDM